RAVPAVLLLSSCTVPLPPIPTLFPYTTLFRSHHPGSGSGCHHPEPGSRGVPLRFGIPAAGVRRAAGGHDAAPASGAVGTRKLPEDRKSTRLNSSHVKISYAVFCLKKKITERQG